MPRFSANLGFLWPDRPLLQRVTAAARAGFKACEFHWPYDVSSTDLRQCCADHDMTLLGVNTPRGDVSKQESGLGAVIGREREFREYFDRTLEYAVSCGASAIHVMAGRVAPEARSAARAVFLENLRFAAARARRHPLTLLLEPLNPRDNPDYFYSTIGEALAMIDELREPSIKLQFDVYHVAITEGDVLTKLRRYLPSIGHVQIAAVPSRAEPDEGEIAYGSVFEALDRLGYRGWVGCEYKPRGDTDGGLTWTRKLGISL